jgi:hypothetical protein
MIKSEFIYNEGLELERKFLESRAIRQVIDIYFDNIETQDRIFKHKEVGEIFDYDIAFKLHKTIIPPYERDKVKIKPWSEIIELEPIEIKREVVKLDVPYQPLKKYSFKERIKILFKGKI